MLLAHNQQQILAAQQTHLALLKRHLHHQMAVQQIHLHLVSLQRILAKLLQLQTIPAQLLYLLFNAQKLQVILTCNVTRHLTFLMAFKKVCKLMIEIHFLIINSA